MRRVSLSLAHVCVLALLVTESKLSAAEITLRYEGTWAFWDSQFEAPEFWETATLNGLLEGVPVSLWFTIEDTAPFNGTTYAGAVVGGQYNVGAFSYRIGVGDAIVSHLLGISAPLSGPPLVGPHTFAPVSIEWTDASPFDVSSLGAAARSVQGAPYESWALPVFRYQTPAVGFYGVGMNQVPGLRLVSVSVPEPGTLMLTLPALAVGLWRQHRSRRPNAPLLRRSKVWRPFMS